MPLIFKTSDIDLVGCIYVLRFIYVHLSVSVYVTTIEEETVNLNENKEVKWESLDRQK